MTHKLSAIKDICDKDSLSIVQNPRIPEILDIRFSVSGVEFRAQSSIDLGGVYGFTVPDPQLLFNLLAKMTDEQI